MQQLTDCMPRSKKEKKLSKKYEECKKIYTKYRFWIYLVIATLILIFISLMCLGLMVMGMGQDLSLQDKMSLIAVFTAISLLLLAISNILNKEETKKMLSGMNILDKYLNTLNKLFFTLAFFISFLTFTFFYCFTLGKFVTFKLDIETIMFFLVYFFVSALFDFIILLTWMSMSQKADLFKHD